VLAWLSVWSEMQTSIWPSWCHYHSLSSASVQSRLVLPFWYQLTHVVLDKGPLNGCVRVSPMGVAQSSSGSVVICYIFLVLWMMPYLHISWGCSRWLPGWGSEVTGSLWLGEYEYLLQAVDARDYFLQSGPTTPQLACWIFMKSCPCIYSNKKMVCAESNSPGGNTRDRVYDWFVQSTVIKYLSKTKCSSQKFYLNKSILRKSYY